MNLDYPFAIHGRSAVTRVIDAAESLNGRARITFRHPRRFVWLTVAALLSGFYLPAIADDWTRFRGPNGSGLSGDQVAPPVAWNAQQNIKWKVDLSGPGLSSPIVVGTRVFLTCWTGYGVDESASPEDLRRHLICVDRHTGNTLWSREVEPTLPEDPYEGMFTENGYASHSPVSDGERVYVFFGKTGAMAFDLDGNQLWKTELGTESGSRGWGSASSPILYGDLLIVTAAAESKSIAALNKQTGEEVWKTEASGFSGTWGTPVQVEVDGGRTEIVVAVPGEVWAFDPLTGKLLWYCDAPTANPVTASVIAQDGIVYVIGGREGGSLAIQAGGMGDVAETHVQWRGNDRVGVGTPLYHDGRIYWISGGVVNCIDAGNGERIYQERLSSSSAPRNEEQDEGGRCGGGRFRQQDYSSPVAADGKLYFVSRSGAGAVLALGPEFQQLASNSLGEEGEEFSATPAISNGELFVRSNRRLYCIGANSP
jgi:outer membrane protein assembly factor BamB